jgi:predicted SAM-dependent methyltransferase
MDSAPKRAPMTPLDFDPARAPRRLNLGCGCDHRPGFVNVDLHAAHEPDLVADIRNLSFLPARHYDELVAQDVLEHLPRTQTRPVLEHWNRLLRDGGLLRLRVPNVVALADLLKTEEYREPAKQLEVIHFLFGTQAYHGDFHFTSFTDVLVKYYLEQSGFRVREIEVFDYWLYDVLAEKERHVEGAPIFDPGAPRETGDDAEFVRNCYRGILQREPDAGGFETFVEALGRGAASREGVIQAMLDSEEYRVRLRPA